MSSSGFKLSYLTMSSMLSLFFPLLFKKTCESVEKADQDSKKIPLGKSERGCQDLLGELVHCLQI